MNKTEVTTNWHWRVPLSWHQLTENEQKEFDYIEEPEENGWERFTRYRGNVIDLHEIIPLKDEWGGFSSDSFFSGIVIRYDEDGEFFQIGTYIAS